MKRFLVVALALFMVLGFAGMGMGSTAPILGFGLDINSDPSVFENNIEIYKGDSVTVDLYVTDMPEPGLQSFGFDLEYDATLLNVTGASIGGDWNFGAGKLDYSTDGLVEMAKAYINFTPPPYGLSGDDVLLGSITFQCEALGLSGLTIYDEDRGGTYADFAMAITGDSLDGQISDGVVIGSINNVPIPSALLLLGSGLVGFIGLGWRKIRG